MQLGVRCNNAQWKVQLRGIPRNCAQKRRCNSLPGYGRYHISFFKCYIFVCCRADNFKTSKGILDQFYFVSHVLSINIILMLCREPYIRIILCPKHDIRIMLCSKHDIRIMLCPKHDIRIMLCPKHDIRIMLCPGHNIRK